MRGATSLTLRLALPMMAQLRREPWTTGAFANERLGFAGFVKFFDKFANGVLTPGGLRNYIPATDDGAVSSR